MTEMPTATGLPRKGDKIEHTISGPWPDKKEELTVVRREGSGAVYSLLLEKPDGTQFWLHEAAWWLKLNYRLVG